MFNFIKKSKKFDYSEKIRRITDVNSDFYFSEAFNMFAINIQYLLTKKETKKIVFTSANAGEGKSMTVFNLACALAQSNKKVLVIDLDLRLPKQHLYFKVSRSAGITDLLCNLASFSEVIQHGDMGVDFIVSGGNTLKPFELISSNMFEETMKSIPKEYDYVLIDAPPVQLVSDAKLILKYCDGTIIVVDKQKTRYPTINKVIKSFEFFDANILGVVLNNFNDDVNRESGYNDANYINAKE